jgi:hypothetical protein
LRVESANVSVHRGCVGHGSHHSARTEPSSSCWMLPSALLLGHGACRACSEMSSTRSTRESPRRAHEHESRSDGTRATRGARSFSLPSPPALCARERLFNPEPSRLDCSHHRDRGASSSVVAAEPRDHWAAHIIRMGAPSCDPAPTPRGDAARHPWAAPRCSVVLPLRRAVVLSSERGRSVSIGATSLMRRCPLRDGAVTVVRYTVGLAVVATHGGGVIVRVA